MAMDEHLRRIAHKITMSACQARFAFQGYQIKLLPKSRTTKETTKVSPTPLQLLPSFASRSPKRSLHQISYWTRTYLHSPTRPFPSGVCPFFSRCSPPLEPLSSLSPCLLPPSSTSLPDHRMLVSSPWRCIFPDGVSRKKIWRNLTESAKANIR